MEDYSETKDWPDFKIKWDLRPKNYRFALDSNSKEHFKDEFPNGAIIGKAELEDVTESLSRISNLPVGQSYNDYTEVIEFWENGDFMTPPIFDISNNDNLILISGGNHRFYVCRGKRIAFVMFIADPKNKEKLEGLLKTIKWLNRFEILMNGITIIFFKLKKLLNGD